MSILKFYIQRNSVKVLCSGPHKTYTWDLDNCNLEKVYGERFCTVLHEEMNKLNYPEKQ